MLSAQFEGKSPPTSGRRSTGLRVMWWAPGASPVCRKRRRRSWRATHMCDVTVTPNT